MPSAKILVVDDHHDTVRVLAKLLSAAGYSLSTAETIAEAKSLCQAQKFDLVIADITLPDGSGIELLSQGADASPAKGILVSGHEEELYETYLEKRAWSDFLLKPLVFETLLETIRRVLGTASRERVFI
jgi:DNA-binding NtrC family response regulator